MFAEFIGSYNDNTEAIMNRTSLFLLFAFCATFAAAQIEQRTLRPSEPTQQQPAGEAEPYLLSVGAFIAGKAGVNTVVATGRKTDVNVNPLPDAGVSILAPLGTGSIAAVGLDIGYATYSFINTPVSGVTDDNTLIEQYSYVNVFPNINLLGVVLGVNVGFSPTGKARTRSDRTVTVVTTGKTELGSDELGTTIELRVGGNFPVWRHQGGHLNLYIMGGYMLSGLYNDYQTYLFSRDNYTTPSADNNPRPASLAIGLAYYFAIPIK